MLKQGNANVQSTYAQSYAHDCSCPFVAYVCTSLSLKAILAHNCRECACVCELKHAPACISDKGGKQQGSPDAGDTTERRRSRGKKEVKNLLDAGLLAHAFPNVSRVRAGAEFGLCLHAGRDLNRGA